MIRKLALVLLFASVGCRGDLWYPPPAELIVESKEEFLLRYSRKPGQLDRYRASYSVRASGSSWMEEDVEQVIYDETIGEVREGLAQVAFRRRDLTRESRRQGRRGQIVEDVPLDRDPDITPNFFVERGSTRKYYVISSRGTFAMRKTRDPTKPGVEKFPYPFHYVIGESLAFLLPILPEEGKKVGVGARWVEELPIIIGRAYMRNDFSLKVEHTVKSVRVEREKKEGKSKKGEKPRVVRKYVVIEFKLAGSFDSGDEEYARRFTDQERTRLRLRTELTGEGKIYFDPVLGKAFWKTLSYTIVSEHGRRVMLPRGETTGETFQVETIETTFSFASRLMAPDEPVRRPRERQMGP